MIEEYESKPCSVEGCHGKMTYSNRVPAPAADAVVAGSEINAAVTRPQPGWICDKNPRHVSTRPA